MSDVKVALSRLERLSGACGGVNVSSRLALSAGEGTGVTGDMGSYEKGQYRVACLIKRARDNIALVAEAGDSLDLARRAEISNSIRRDINAMKKECTALSRVAVKDGKRAEYVQLLSHVNKTEQIQRRLHNVPPLGDATQTPGDIGVHPVGSPGLMSGSHPHATDPISREGVPLISSSDAEEFALFYEQTRQRDAEIDQMLDKIGAGVTRLQENALTLRSELCVQQRLLDETEVKMEGVHARLDIMNRKLRQTLKQAGRDRVSVYIFCCLLLLSIYGAIYTISR